MTKRFKLTWCDVTEYTATVEASSKEEAMRIFHEQGLESMEPTGWVEMEPDSLEVEEENN